MNKVNGIYRMATMLLAGMVLGIFISYTVLSKVTSGGEGQNITIGNLKIKNSSEIENLINLDQDSQDDNSTKKKGFFKRNK